MLAVVNIPENLHPNRRQAVVRWRLGDTYYSQTAYW